jgi:hypothetical protein
MRARSIIQSSLQIVHDNVRSLTALAANRSPRQEQTSKQLTMPNPARTINPAVVAGHKVIKFRNLRSCRAGKNS